MSAAAAQFKEQTGTSVSKAAQEAARLTDGTESAVRACKDSLVKQLVATLDSPDMGQGQARNWWRHIQKLASGGGTPTSRAKASSDRAASRSSTSGRGATSVGGDAAPRPKGKKREVGEQWQVPVPGVPGHKTTRGTGIGYKAARVAAPKPRCSTRALRKFRDEVRHDIRWRHIDAWPESRVAALTPMELSIALQEARAFPWWGPSMRFRVEQTRRLRAANFKGRD